MEFCFFLPKALPLGWVILPKALPLGYDMLPFQGVYGFFIFFTQGVAVGLGYIALSGRIWIFLFF